MGNSALVLHHGVIDMMLPITLNCGYPINNSLVLWHTPASPRETLLTSLKTPIMRDGKLQLNPLSLVQIIISFPRNIFNFIKAVP